MVSCIFDPAVVVKKLLDTLGQQFVSKTNVRDGWVGRHVVLQLVHVGKDKVVMDVHIHDIHGCMPEHEVMNLMEKLSGTVTLKGVDLHAVGENNVHVALKQVFAQRDISAIPKYQEQALLTCVLQGCALAFASTPSGVRQETLVKR